VDCGYGTVECYYGTVECVKGLWNVIMGPRNEKRVACNVIVAVQCD
jgi:hypothetical protein